VVNPRQVRDFAKATGTLAKTDALDAAVLAHFAEAIRPSPRPVPDATTQTLAALEVTKKQAGDFETQARAWIAKLEADVRAVQEELRQSNAAREALAKEVDALRLSKEALDRLPSPARRLLLKLAFDARR